MSIYFAPANTDNHTTGLGRFVLDHMNERVADRSDPAAKIQGMPPNFGESAVPHLVSYQSLVGSYSKVYLPSDEALQHSLANARYMRNDVGIMECILARQRAVALLDWSIKPEDENDPNQVDLAEKLTRIVKRVPRFIEYRRNLLEAIWYGRSGIQHQYGWHPVGRQRRVFPGRQGHDNNGWFPIHGDKIVFRYDDGSSDHIPHQMGIRVSHRHRAGQKINGRWKVEPTGRGLAYFLSGYERDGIIVHKHRIEDGAYEDINGAGAIHGTGLRSLLYWEWFQKQELLAFLMEYLERSAGGIEVWEYPANDPKAKEKMEEAAKERLQHGRSTLFFPKPLGDEHLYNLNIIEPGFQGIEAVKDLLENYFGHRTKRLILGQTLSSEAAATGLGSGVAELQYDTYLQIIRYDALNLAETITHELVRPIQLWNFPGSDHLHMEFKIELESADSEKILNSYRAAWDMGATIAEADILEAIGASQPKPTDRVLDNPDIESAKLQLRTQQVQLATQAAMAQQGVPTQQAQPQQQALPFGDESTPDPGGANEVIDAVGDQQPEGTRRYVAENGYWVPREQPVADTGERIPERQIAQYAKDSKGEKDGPEWMKVGGASAYVDDDGQILHGCPGLEGENVADLHNESDESRERRNKRKEIAEDQGLTGEDLTPEETQKLGEDLEADHWDDDDTPNPTGQTESQGDASETPQYPIPRDGWESRVPMGNIPGILAQTPEHLKEAVNAMVQEMLELTNGAAQRKESSIAGMDIADAQKVWDGSTLFEWMDDPEYDRFRELHDALAPEQQPQNTQDGQAQYKELPDFVRERLDGAIEVINSEANNAFEYADKFGESERYIVDAWNNVKKRVDSYRDWIDNEFRPAAESEGVDADAILTAAGYDAAKVAKLDGLRDEWNGDGTTGESLPTDAAALAQRWSDRITDTTPGYAQELHDIIEAGSKLRGAEFREFAESTGYAQRTKKATLDTLRNMVNKIGVIETQLETSRKVESDLAGQVEALESQRSGPIGVPGEQQSMFPEIGDGTGQKQLFNVAKPGKTTAKKSQDGTQAILNAVNERTRKILAGKETLSPADTGIQAQAEPLPGQSSMEFDDDRSDHKTTREQVSDAFGGGRSDSAMSNVALDKRSGGSLDSQIKRGVAKAKEEKQARVNDARHTLMAKVAEARTLYDEVGEKLVKSTAKKHGNSVKDIRDTLRVMVDTNPESAISMLNKFKERAGSTAAQSGLSLAERWSQAIRDTSDGWQQTARHVIDEASALKAAEFKQFISDIGLPAKSKKAGMAELQNYFDRINVSDTQIKNR